MAIDLKVPFLEALLYAEGDEPAKQEGISPYYILCGGGSFEKLPRDATGFPLWNGLRGSWGVSHAAGRAQFEPRTWAAQCAKLHLALVSGYSHIFDAPVNQDAAAWDLAATVYRSQVGRDLLEDLTAMSINSVGSALHLTWTSVSAATFPERYRAALAGAPSTTPVSPTPSGTPSAQVLPGSDGTPVIWLQHALNAAGVIPVLAVDGVYGRDTDDAVRAFQISVGLPVTGTADTAVLAKLEDFM
jgi:muramidase (phage lysozyme)